MAFHFGNFVKLLRRKMCIRDSDIPEGKDAVIEEFNNALKESVAETSEEFMDKFFGGEDFTYAEMIQGLRQGVRELSLFPVLCGSAVNCMGSLLSLIHIYVALGVGPDGAGGVGGGDDGEIHGKVLLLGKFCVSIITPAAEKSIISLVEKGKI